MSIFTSIPISVPKRSRHNLSYNNRFSARFGRLYPVMCRKIVPGDRIKMRAQSFIQMGTFGSKIFQDFVCKQEFFFVPSRLLWKDFEKFIVSTDDLLIHPYINYAQIIIEGYAKHGSIFDYFNLPTFYYPDGYEWDYSDKSYEDWHTYASELDWNKGLNNEDFQRINNIFLARSHTPYHIDALPFFAFQKVYAEFYADENLQTDKADWDSIFEDLQNYITNQSSNLTEQVIAFSSAWNLQQYNRNYPKDYFTGCLPFAQKGPSVNVPTSAGTVEFSRNTQTTSNWTGAGFKLNDDGSAELRYGTSSSNNPMQTKVVFPNGLTSIENLRSAAMLEAFYEKNGRGGTRYKETIYSHFGVLVPDGRLQRALFLQGVTTPIQLGNVYSTSADKSASGITGEAFTVGTGAGFSRRRKFGAYEHGYIISLWSCYPRAAYFQGIPHEFLELDKFDYYWPDFQHLGEQDVKVLELSIGNANQGIIAPQDDDTFGYVPRYSQYKVAMNQIHGDLRNSRKYQTAARDLQLARALNKDFIAIRPDLNDLNRVFSVNDTLLPNHFDTMDVDIAFTLDASRPMDYYGVPRIL